MRVIIPWYGSHARRYQACMYVVNHLCSSFDEVQLVRLRTGTMAQHRNAGLQGYDGAVVVFNDADSVVPAEQIRRAAETAADGHGVVFAYDLYLRLDQASTDRLISDSLDPEEHLTTLGYERELIGPASIGCVAVSTECPSFDEDFHGWGYEDLEWLHRCRLELGPHRRIPGPLFHLWHGTRREDDSPEDALPDLVRKNREHWLASSTH